MEHSNLLDQECRVYSDGFDQKNNKKYNIIKQRRRNA